MLRALLFGLLAPLALGAPDPARFAREIDRFDAQDAKSPPTLLPGIPGFRVTFPALRG